MERPQSSIAACSGSFLSDKREAECEVFLAVTSWLLRIRGPLRPGSLAYIMLNAFFMAAEVAEQAWSMGIARRGALKGSAWMGPS
jgi:hypothetical protein